MFRFTALLLNLEGVLTALLAWFVFRENFDRRIALGMTAIVAGGLVLSWGGSLNVRAVLGPLMIAGACLAWAVDNNLTRKVSQADPVQIALLKGCVAGTGRRGNDRDHQQRQCREPKEIVEGIWVASVIHC
jgi:drug/metabolite transporter (DMT)-like permease